VERALSSVWLRPSKAKIGSGWKQGWSQRSTKISLNRVRNSQNLEEGKRGKRVRSLWERLHRHLL
jgi:hypothetical protein